MERGLDVRLAVLEQIVKDTSDDVKQVLARIDGPPYEHSINARLFKLEKDAEALILRRQGTVRAWSRTEKLAMLCLGLCTALGPWLTLAVR